MRPGQKILTIGNPGLQIISPRGGVAAIPWWLTGGVASANAIGAYSAIRTASQAASYVNLANPGTYNLTATGVPVWQHGCGWYGFDTSKYLDTGISAGQLWTAICRHSIGIVATYGFVFGADSATNRRFYLFPNAGDGSGGQRAYGAGGYIILTGGQSDTGVSAIAGRQGYWNGVADGAQTNAAYAADANERTLLIGIANRSSLLYPWAGEIQSVAVYNTELTAPQVAALSAVMPGYSADALVFHGDSLTLGQGATAGSEYPKVVTDNMPTYDRYQYAIAGRYLADMVTEAAANVDKWITANHTNHICVIWGGSNDIDGGVTAATAFANLETYIAARLTAGFDSVLVLTALDRAQYDAAQRIEYEAYNAAIRASAYNVADVDADARLQDYTNLTYFNADQVHLSDAGYAVVAGIVKTAIEAL